MLTIALVSAALGYAAFIVVGCGLQERLIFPRHFAGEPTVDPVAPTQRIWVSQTDERVVAAQTKPDEGAWTEAWFELAADRSPERPGPAVLYFHGNGEIVEEVPRVVWDVYLRNGVSVAMLEYRGYGNADGAPGQAVIARDARLLCDWIAEQESIDAERLIYHGRSLGGAVAAQLAREREPAAMVLDSTFTSAVAMAHRHLMPGFLLRHTFKTDDVLAASGWPVLLSHGTADSIVPASHSKKLHELTPDSTLHMYKGDGHNDMPRATLLYNERLIAFLRMAGVLARTEEDGPAANDGSGAVEDGAAAGS